MVRRGDEERILELRGDGALERVAEARALVDAGAAGAHMRARALLTESDPLDRELAARILGEIAADGARGAVRATEDLATLVAGDEDVVVLEAALAALGRLWDATPARDGLVGLVGHPSYIVRWRLPEALVSAHHAGDTELEAAIAGLASDERAIVRREAVRAVGTLPQPWVPASEATLASALHDPDDAVIVAALWALARGRRPLPPGVAGALLTPARLGALTSGVAERLLEAVALAADRSAYAPLEALGTAWTAGDAELQRTLTAALAWCAPQEWAPSDGDEPGFDRRLARWLMGKTVLVGLTYVSAVGDPLGRRQLHGVVTRCDERLVALAVPGRDEEFTLPPDTRAFRYAPAGRYRMRDTGLVVEDPDAECAWTVTEGD
ncbi:MAG: HEAT repeat domain-containing protein [Thermoleophilia bacterium]